jgi:hypothetical protein
MMHLALSDNEFIVGFAFSCAVLHHFTLQYPVQAPFVTTLRCYAAAVPCFLISSYYLQDARPFLSYISTVAKAYLHYVPPPGAIRSNQPRSSLPTFSKSSIISFSAIEVFQGNSAAKPLTGDCGRYTAQAVPIAGSKLNI